MNTSCHLLACDREITSSEARVEVAIASAPGVSGSVKWPVNENGSRHTLSFHRRCWHTALSSASPAEKRVLKKLLRTAEKFDSAEELHEKAKRAAQILKTSKRAICFTGAGLSTAAGLGDYRGKSGKWTLESEGSSLQYTTEYESLRPTFAHEAVAKLADMKKLAYVVSQNADGLHHLSGIEYTHLSDVHGSAFTEYCPKCRKRYVRDSYVPEDRAEDYFAGILEGPKPAHIKKCSGCRSNHWTGRQCDDCGGPLHDTVISFGDGLEQCVLKPAISNAKKADACLSLGSTMSIGPSNQVVYIHQGPLIVCVRQDTEMDEICEETNGVRAYGDCDDFMRHLMIEMLGAAGYEEWEASLQAKRAVYDQKRPVKGKKRGDIFVKKM